MDRSSVRESENNSASQ